MAGTIRQERLGIWHRINEAMGSKSWDKANSEMQALITNLKPTTEDIDGVDLEGKLKDLNEEMKDNIREINEETQDAPPLDKNHIRTRRYNQARTQRLKDLHEHLSNLLHDHDLVPLTGLKQERLAIYSRVDEAMGSNSWARAGAEMQVLITNIKPRMEATDEDIEAFLKKLNENLEDRYEEINQETKSEQAMDMNAKRRRMYAEARLKRMKKLHEYLSMVLQKYDLIPTGE